MSDPTEKKPVMKRVNAVRLFLCQGFDEESKPKAAELSKFWMSCTAEQKQRYADEAAELLGAELDPTEPPATNAKVTSA